MPYIEIKAYPRDEATKQALAEEINKVVLDIMKCPPQAITIGMEDVQPENWQSQVADKIIAPKKSSMLILDGEKQY